MSESASTNTNTNDTEPPTVNLWSFISKSKATQFASLRRLQQFVLSLNKNELQHLIETYLKSKLTPNNNPNGTLNESHTQILQNNTLQSKRNTAIDEQILSKMSSAYQRKYNAKIVSKMQQNSTLLSIPPQLLSYSFQYLSYSENCRLSPVCLCFFYTKKKYIGLNNYYIQLNQSFVYKAIRNRINLTDLVQFKHIEINHALYQRKNYYDRVPEWTKQTKLFQYVLDTIINQSRNSLHTLTINIGWGHYESSSYTRQSFNFLLYFVSNFKGLQINTLILKKGLFKAPPKRVDDLWNRLQSKIVPFFSKLTRLECGNYYPLSWGRNSNITPLLSKHIISPLMNNIHCNLRELKLNIPNNHIFEENEHLLTFILQNKMPNLTKLSIHSKIASNVSHISHIQYCSQIKELNLSLFGKNIRAQTTNILSNLFSSFVGLNKFIFTYQNHTRSVRNDIKDGLSLDWKELFGILCRKKIVFTMDNNNGSVNPLQYIELNDLQSIRSQFKCDNIARTLDDILYLQNETYFDIKHFGVNIDGFGGNKRLRNLTDKSLIPFMNGMISLESLDLSFGRHSIGKFEENYMSPILKLLSNIPKGLHSLKIKSPNYGWTTPYGRERWKELSKEIKMKNIGSNELVSKLCQMATDKTDESELKCIVLNEFKMSKKAKEYLRFFFGYNDNVFIDKNKYCLSFNF